MVRRASLATLLFLLPYISADGYPKETPGTSFNTGTTGSSQTSQLPDSSNAGGYPKETPITPFNTGNAGGTQASKIPDSSNGGGYPPLSMDFNSRYRGPVAMLMVLPDGHIADTAEVTAARATHLAALDKAKALWAQAGTAGGQDGMGHGGSQAGGSAGGDDGYSYPQPGSNSLVGGFSGSQTYGPPQVGSGGSGSQGQGGTSSAAVGSAPYDGPLAMLMVLPDGHIADTAEVTAARAAHLAALDKAKALWAQAGTAGGQDGMGHGGSQAGGSAGGDDGYNYPQPGSNTLVGGFSGGQTYGPPQGGSGGSDSQGQGGSPTSATTMDSSMYDGPLAMLMVLPSGFLADTPDIAALRAAHLSALLKAQAAWKPQDGKQH